jgi:hypothetical protein
MDEIVDHKMDHSAVGHDDSMSLTMAGDIAGEPPEGWKLCVRWKDGEHDVRLKEDMKDSDPLRSSTPSITNWWSTQFRMVGSTCHAEEGQDHQAAKTRHFRTNQKYGLRSQDCRES